MRKFIEEKGENIVILFMIIGLVFSIFRIFTLNYEKRYEEEKEILYSYKEQVVDYFDKIYEIEDAKINIQENNYIVTICTTDHNLELCFDKDYKLISEQIVTQHSKFEYIFFYIMFYAVILPLFAYMLLQSIFEMVYWIVDIVKEKKKE